MAFDNINLPNRNRLNLNIDLRLVCLLLFAGLVATLLLWSPWSGTDSANDRTVQVTGEAKVTAEPDEFIFYPSYEFKNADKTAALAELSKKSDEIVLKLKELGVKDSRIKTSSNGYDYQPYLLETDDSTYTLTFTVQVTDKVLAQKVQDYLVGTAPQGAVSPQPAFSDSKRKELESKARDEASKDARAKAEQMAKNIGFKLGNVKSVSDNSGFGGPISIMDSTASSEDSSKLSIQPGENDLSYSVTVTYFVR